MKKTLLALCAALAASAIPTIASAELAFNAGVVTDYRYRGISQSRLKPALQGGVDFTQGGLYLGAWASSIKWIKDASGGASYELDLYGGYKGELVKDVGYDVGVLNYWYPSAVTSGWSATPYVNPNTTELYGALSYGPVTAKYSHGMTALFGNVDSKNSGYVDLSASFDVGGGVTLAPHLGYQKVSGNGDFSYTDYSLTASMEVAKGLTASLAVVGADTKSIGGTKAYASPANGKDLGKAGVVLGLKFAF